jgi:hypothetical protein
VLVNERPGMVHRRPRSNEVSAMSRSPGRLCWLGAQA